MNKFLNGSLALLLWLTSVGLGIVVLSALHNALLIGYAWIISRTGSAINGYEWAVLVSQGSVILLAIGLVGFVIGTGEYHAKHFGEQRSWRLFGWTLGIQLLILLATYPL